MSKPITKEMWTEIEKEMAGGWVAIAFSYKGHEVSVNRVRESESKTCLQVYIDGAIKGAWVSLNNDVSDEVPKILPDVWCKKTKAKHSTKTINGMTKIYGKRRVKKECPDLHDKWIYHSPNFSKASVLCRQFKKLEELELTKARCLEA